MTIIKKNIEGEAKVSVDERGSVILCVDEEYYSFPKKYENLLRKIFQERRCNLKDLYKYKERKKVEDLLSRLILEGIITVHPNNNGHTVGNK